MNQSISASFLSHNILVAEKTEPNVWNHRGSSRCEPPCSQELCGSAGSCFGVRTRARFEENSKLHKDSSVGCLLGASATGINSCAAVQCPFCHPAWQDWEWKLGAQALNSAREAYGIRELVIDLGNWVICGSFDQRPELFKFRRCFCHYCSVNKL